MNCDNILQASTNICESNDVDRNSVRGILGGTAMDCRKAADEGNCKVLHQHVDEWRFSR